MSDNTSNKKIEIEDNFNKEHIEQLHRVILNFSEQSFEIKKMCVTVEVAAFTLLVTAFKDHYTDKLFVQLLSLIGILTPAFFYLLDICTYYYQDKLRMQMHNEENSIRTRHHINLEMSSRFDRKKKYLKFNRIVRAIINGSNIIYWGLILLAVILQRII